MIPTVTAAPKMVDRGVGTWKLWRKHEKTSSYIIYPIREVLVLSF